LTICGEYEAWWRVGIEGSINEMVNVGAVALESKYILLVKGPVNAYSHSLEFIQDGVYICTINHMLIRIRSDLPIESSKR